MQARIALLDDEEIKQKSRDCYTVGEKSGYISKLSRSICWQLFAFPPQRIGAGDVTNTSLSPHNNWKEMTIICSASSVYHLILRKRCKKSGK